MQMREQTKIVMIGGEMLKFTRANDGDRGAQWLSGRVLDLRLRCCWFEPHWRHFVVSLSKTLYPMLSLLCLGSTEEDPS